MCIWLLLSLSQLQLPIVLLLVFSVLCCYHKIKAQAQWQWQAALFTEAGRGRESTTMTRKISYEIPTSDHSPNSWDHTKPRAMYWTVQERRLPGTLTPHHLRMYMHLPLIIDNVYRQWHSALVIFCKWKPQSSSTFANVRHVHVPLVKNRFALPINNFPTFQGEFYAPAPFDGTVVMELGISVL